MSSPLNLTLFTHPAFRLVTGIDASKQSGPDAVRIDVPLRVFTESYYPNLTSLVSRMLSPFPFVASAHFSRLSAFCLHLQYSKIDIAITPEDYASSFTMLDGPAVFGMHSVCLSVSVLWLARARFDSLLCLCHVFAGYRNFLFGKRSIPFPSPSSWIDTQYWKLLWCVLSIPALPLAYTCVLPACVWLGRPFTFWR